MTIHRHYDLEIRVPQDEGSRSFDFVFSSAAIDSYDEIVEQDWVLARYQRNPVVLWNHNLAARGFLSGGPAEAALPIGKGRNVRVEDGQLRGTIDLVSAKASPIVEYVYNGLREGSLRATSVGFQPGDVRLEKRDGRGIYVLSQNELHEISIVPVPANPDAVMRAARAEELRGLSLRRRSTDAHRARTRTTSPEETRMDPEKELLEAKAALLASEERCKALDVQAKALDAHGKALVRERDEAIAREKAATERAEKAERGVVEAEVRALVPKKLDPAEVDNMIELATTNRALFEKMMGQRQERTHLTSPGSVLTQRENTVRSANGGGVSPEGQQAYVDELNREAGITR